MRTRPVVESERNLLETIETAERFVRSARRVHANLRRDLADSTKTGEPLNIYAWPYGADTAAMKRASMDLTKLLARIRKPNGGAQ